MAKIRFTLQERTSLHFERELVAMVAALPGIEHHERPEYLDKLEILREQRAAFAQAVYAVTESIGVLIQAAGTGFLLFQVHPLLLVLPVLNLISFVTDARGGAIMVEASEEQRGRRPPRPGALPDRHDVQLLQGGAGLRPGRRDAGPPPPGLGGRPHEDGPGRRAGRRLGSPRRVHRRRRQHGRSGLRRAAGAGAVRPTSARS